MFRHSPALAALGAGVILALCAPAASAAPFESYFASQAGARVCYARDYSADELRANPDQKVSAVRLAFGPTTQLGKRNRSQSFDLGLAFRQKGKTEWYRRVAYCKTVGDGFQCSAEGDAGSFRLEPSGRSGLRLKTGGLDIEGDRDWLSIGATRLGYLVRRVANDSCAKAGAKVR